MRSVGQVAVHDGFLPRGLGVGAEAGAEGGGVAHPVLLVAVVGDLLVEAGERLQGGLFGSGRVGAAGPLGLFQLQDAEGLLLVATFLQVC